MVWDRMAGSVAGWPSELRRVETPDSVDLPHQSDVFLTCFDLASTVSRHSNIRQQIAIQTPHPDSHVRTSLSTLPRPSGL